MFRQQTDINTKNITMQLITVIHSKNLIINLLLVIEKFWFCSHSRTRRFYVGSLVYIGLSLCSQQNLASSQVRTCFSENHSQTLNDSTIKYKYVHFQLFNWQIIFTFWLTVMLNSPSIHNSRKPSTWIEL